MLFEIASFYLTGAVVCGILIARAKTVSVRIGGRVPPYPRLVGSIAGGLLWPIVIATSIFQKRDEAPKQEAMESEDTARALDIVERDFK